MSRRIEKVAELLKTELARMIASEFSDEYLMITVTEVEVTADFKNAKVLITCLNKSDEKEALLALEKKAKEFQALLGKMLKMKFTPKLTFRDDQSADKVDRVEELLKEINKK